MITLVSFIDIESSILSLLNESLIPSMLTIILKNFLIFALLILNSSVDATSLMKIVSCINLPDGVQDREELRRKIGEFASNSSNDTVNLTALSLSVSTLSILASLIPIQLSKYLDISVVPLINET
jgi:hypothetical protein